MADGLHDTVELCTTNAWALLLLSCCHTAWLALSRQLGTLSKHEFELMVGLSPPHTLEEGSLTWSTRVVGAWHLGVFKEARGSVDA